MISLGWTRALKLTLLALLQTAALAATTTPRIIPSFEENRGQAEAPVRFLAKGQGFTVMLTPSEATWTAGGHTVRMTMPGARANPILQPLGKLPGVSNYIQVTDSPNIAPWSGVVSNKGGEGCVLF